MDKIKTLREGKPENIKWLSTHPTNEERQILLDRIMPHAIKLREICQVCRYF